MSPLSVLHMGDHRGTACTSGIPEVHWAYVLDVKTLIFRLETYINTLNSFKPYPNQPFSPSNVSKNPNTIGMCILRFKSAFVALIVFIQEEEVFKQA